MIKFDIFSTPPTTDQIQSLKKQRESIIIRFFRALKFGSIPVFGLFVVLVYRYIEQQTFLVVVSGLVTCAAVYIYSIMVDLGREISFLEELEDPSDIVAMCKQDAIVERYRQAVIGTGRPLVNAEGLLIQRVARENQRVEELKKLKSIGHLS